MGVEPPETKLEKSPMISTDCMISFQIIQELMQARLN